MGRKPLFSMAALTRESAQVKRHILNEIRRGRLLKIDKTYALTLIARRLQLSDRRSLYDNGKRQDYLEHWYDKLLEDAKPLFLHRHLQDEPHAYLQSTIEGSDLVREVERLRAHCAMLNQALSEYRKAVEMLRYENQALRASRLPVISRIDD